MTGNSIRAWIVAAMLVIFFSAGVYGIVATHSDTAATQQAQIAACRLSNKHLRRVVNQNLGRPLRDAVAHVAGDSPFYHHVLREIQPVPYARCERIYGGGDPPFYRVTHFPPASIPHRGSPKTRGHGGGTAPGTAVAPASPSSGTAPATSPTAAGASTVAPATPAAPPPTSEGGRAPPPAPTPNGRPGPAGPPGSQGPPGGSGPPPETGGGGLGLPAPPPVCHLAPRLC